MTCKNRFFDLSPQKAPFPKENAVKYAQLEFDPISSFQDTYFEYDPGIIFKKCVWI